MKPAEGEGDRTRVLGILGNRVTLEEDGTTEIIVIIFLIS